MAEHPESEHDDEYVGRLFKPLDVDAAPVDDELLARTRALSLVELANASVGNAADAFSEDTETQVDPESSSSRVTVQRDTFQQKGKRMFTLATRAVIGVTALAVAGFFLFFNGGDVEAISLGQILDATRQAKTLHLQVVKNGDVTDVWMKQGGRLRWQTSPTSYRIANGTSLWEIDEEANIARRNDDEAFASAAANLDLLALLGIGEKGASLLRTAKPKGRQTHDGTECRVYRTTMSVAGRELTFEAFVDEQTNQLRDIVAWPAGQTKRVGPPVAELRFVALNADIDDLKFEFAKSLSEDGRIGKITDRQGIVLLRPKLYRRWTPICKQMRLKPGDQLKTDVRGANAVAARLTSGATITVGPGTLAELISPQVIRLHYGELQVANGKLAEFEIRGARVGLARPQSDDATLYQIDPQGKLAIVPHKPVWLLGFEGASTNESIGSLITKVDGRDVPLTIGYHKVKVEIRDQIARTTIEESFVNRTSGRLEGIFHFPLPQDASISGFGMWINGELVEADVVEKQRAREIYETILRERRDPGLLEWTGGNIFKARVFPIEAHSEKRIKIVYTQVLALRGNQYRYSYALRSEMLQKTPLRELSIDVFVNSALPLKKIDSPTHPVRIERTDHSASIQFSAQEYTPTRDFELVFDIDGRTSDVVTIPHRRGEDGYFMIQLMPPSVAGNWQREVLPDGDPLEVLLVCDTSGSMDKANRLTQAEFVGAVLSSLGADDRFNIAVCDADCKWLFEQPVSPDDENVDRARTWLDDRISLGWTDLDAAFASIQKRVQKKSHVVYIGDGIVSARDVNAEDFAARVRRLYGNKPRGTFHAVSTGSSFESVVLKAIGSLGRGSVRQIGSGQTPMSIALELLNEIARPGLRDLNVEFRGIQVAAVYPAELPNLAAGTQQILIGRYLPTGEDQSGEIVVTGTRDGEAVTYSAKIPLKDAEQGNSFIPRLWARAHLDDLLQQGSSQFIKDEIIGLSEEFHIITPYTSLLVLETDEDRERFGVKRRFEMRDGERFFADGRDAANYELAQKVMREAGNWRLGLRYQVLRQLARLGRERQIVQHLKQWADQRRSRGNVSTTFEISSSLSESDFFLPEGSAVMGGSIGGGFAGGSGGAAFGQSWQIAGQVGAEREVQLLPMASAEPTPSGGMHPLELSDESDEEMKFEDSLFEQNATMDFESGFFVGGRKAGELAAANVKGEKSLMGLGVFGPQSNQPMRSQPMLALQPSEKPSGYILAGHDRRSYNTPNYVAWLRTIFPHLPVPPPKAFAKPLPEQSTWPAEAIVLSQSLLRNNWLEKLAGGLEIRVTSDTHDPRWNRQTGHTESLDLFSHDAWLTWSFSGGNGKTINWYDLKERGAISETYSLGRVRKSDPEERRKSIGVADHAFGSGLHRSYARYTIEIIDGPNITQFLLTSSNSPRQQLRISIDVTKKLVVESQTLLDGKVTWTKTFSDLVEIQGAWWPRKVKTVDAEGRLTSSSTTTFIELNDQEFAARHAEELMVREQIQFLHHPVPTIEEAETSEADGSADFEDRLALIVRSSQIQKWDEVLKQLGELEELVGGAAGKRWIRLEILTSARRNAEALDLVREDAAKLSESQPADLARAQHMIRSARSIADANETLALLLQLKPVYDRQPEYSGAKWIWQGHQINSLRNLQRIEELLALEKLHAEEQPWALHVQTQYARELVAFGNHQAAYAWLKAVIARDATLYPHHQRDQIWQTWADMLQQQGESAAQIEVVKQWLADEPENEHPYSRYLAALTFDDRMDEVREVALQWLKEGRVEGQLSPAAKARTSAAINYGLGQAWNIYFNVVTPKWYEPLQTTALYFMEHEHHFHFTSHLMDRHQFSNTDAADVVRVRMFEELQNNAAAMKPNMLDAYVRWVRQGKPDENSDDWKPIVAVIRNRWNGLQHTEEPDDEKHAVGDTLTSIYASFFRDADYLPFLRERIGQSNDKWRDQYVTGLFNALLSLPWTEEVEVELFGVLAEISKNSPATQLLTQVESAHQLVDRMLAARAEADQKQLQDTGHPETLTRQELAEKKTAFQKAAREGVADRLGAESKKHEGLFGEWLQMERMYLDVRLSRRFEAVAAECVVMLGDKPPVSPDEEAEDDEAATAEEFAIETAEELVRAALRQRALITYANLAVRQSAEPELRAWLMAYIDSGIEGDGDNVTTWKQLKYHLLVALNEPQQLEQVVRNWIQNDTYVTGWRLLLARLSAERGEIDEAIDLFERIEKDSQLAPADYATLATWYLVRDQKEDHRRAKVESLKAFQEYQLSNFVNQHRSRWQDRNKPLPSELDEQVLFAFQALFELSHNPGNYLRQLRDFYTACRDFRLLKMLPDSIVGRTPQQVYGFLGQLNTTILGEVRKESTADEIMVRVEELRQRDLTTIDLRALDLFEALVERRSAEVLNQPGPHVEASVAALKRAFDRQWADGEGRQMAQFLDSLGQLKQADLAAEQTRQLELLYTREEPGTDDRLFTGWYTANSRFSHYDNRAEGLQRMEIVIREYEQSHSSGWPNLANVPFDGYVRMLERMRRHAEAERFLKQHLAKALNTGQRHWMMERLTSVYSDALAVGTRVSLGENTELYQNLIPFIVKQAERGDDNHRRQILQRLQSVFRTAKAKEFPTLRPDMRKFTFETLPPLLKRQRNNYRMLIDQWSSLLRQLLDERISLEFLIERIENYPSRLRYSWENPWQQFGYQLANGRKKVNNLGDLEPRLLAIVLAELRRDLETRNHHSRYLYRKNYYFWDAKEAVFAKLAEEILAEQRDSERSVRHIADYFWGSLHHQRRAIEILFVALKEDKLDDYGKEKLVDWLHDGNVKRYAESIAILEGLVERHDIRMRHRCRLITAYHQTGRTAQRSELMSETIELFRQGGRWNESNLSQLARCVHFNHLDQRTVQLMGELIPMRQRSHPMRGIGDGTLSSYYSWLSDAHSRLKQTQEAVDAAAAAIVSWGSSHSQRSSAIRQLDAVTRNAEDLDDYVTLIDKQAEDTGQDSSIIRRSIGTAYSKKREYKKAITQLRLSIELQPGDLDTHNLLMSAYDALKDKDGAVRQLLALIDIDRHNVSHYVEIEKRLRDDEELAERAATAVVEASPNEAEYHEALAKIRTAKKQHTAAVLHWQQVAELRSLEPNGLINLAKAQIQANLPAAADKTITQLQKTSWPTRFESTVRDALNELNRLKQIP